MFALGFVYVPQDLCACVEIFIPALGFVTHALVSMTALDVVSLAWGVVYCMDCCDIFYLCFFRLDLGKYYFLLRRFLDLLSI